MVSPGEINHQTENISKLTPLDSQPPNRSEQGNKVPFLGRSWSSIQNLLSGESLSSSRFLSVVAKVIDFSPKNVGVVTPENLKTPEALAPTSEIQGSVKKDEQGIQAFLFDKIKELFSFSKAVGKVTYSSPTQNNPINQISSQIFDPSIGNFQGTEKGRVSTHFKENMEAAAEQQKKQVAKRNFTIDLTLQPKAMNVVTVRRQCYKDSSGIVNREFNYSIDGAAKEINGRSVGVSSSIGARSQMEDRAVALRQKIGEKEVEIYGVFDGHGGADCAQFASEHLREYFSKAMEGKDVADDESFFSAIGSSFEEIESNFYLEKNLKGGSTALAVFISGDDAWIANIGDSRAILVQSDGTAVQATEDAKPDIPKFKRQIILHGGSVQQRPGDIPRVNGQLAVARSLGDSNKFKGVTSKAELTRFPLKEFENGFLVVACDGLWDVATTDQVGAAIAMMGNAGWDAKAMSQGLVYHAIGHGSQDNVTVLVVPLKRGG